ncbi:DUF3883 domain-containing protein [Streptomyces sp. NPDC006638]|uniref:protein NO VEIN domain-containing protein n=1 Tax=Streptomyces sp. NPDC006638 TaxID=3157183 RepID=UPI0033B3844C
MLLLSGEGTRRAALRWLAHLHKANAVRTRVLFTHHPRYRDLTPAQYTESLAWLRRAGLVTAADRPIVDISWSDIGDEGERQAVPVVLWSQTQAEARAHTGTAGELALLGLLLQAGLNSVRHVAEHSDAYGYDIAASVSAMESMHLEVKSTTDPTRLVAHLTRHEYEVMRRDSEWTLSAVLVGSDGSALCVATVSRKWLRTAVPEDRSRNGRWESVRLTVPPYALAPGLTAGHGRLVLPEALFPVRGAWGMQPSVVVPT